MVKLLLRYFEEKVNKTKKTNLCNSLLTLYFYKIKFCKKRFDALLRTPFLKLDTVISHGFKKMGLPLVFVFDMTCIHMWSSLTDGLDDLIIIISTIGRSLYTKRP